MQCQRTKATFVPKLTHFGQYAAVRILAFYGRPAGRVLGTPGVR